MKKKKLISILLVVAMMFSIMPTAVWADVETQGETPTHSNHCICGATHADVGDHTTAQAITWQPWDSDNSLPGEAGTYYLTKDVTLSRQWNPNFDVTLCLNGHSITQKGSGQRVIQVGYYSVDPVPCTMTITDCGNNERYGYWDGNSYTITGQPPNGVNNYDTLIGGIITGGQPTNDGKDGGGVNIFPKSTFNMYGGNIAGNTARSGGGVCVKGGSRYITNFNMYGGNITGNIASGDTGRGGGGVYAYNCTFTMEGGNITNNSNSGGYGGGVYVYGESSGNSTFNMKGGDITNNNASNTSAVYCGNNSGSCTFNMSGGSITNNTATASEGKAVVVYGSIGLSGDCTIFGNKTGNVESNLFVPNDRKITINNPLTGDAKIGVTTQTKPNGNNVVKFARESTSYTNSYGSDKSYRNKFKSDNPDFCVIKYANTELQLIVAPKYDISLGDSNGTVEGKGEFSVDKNPAPVGSIVTITAEPKDGYEVDTVTVIGANNVTVTKNNDGTYSFTMPENAVEVQVTFKVKKVTITVSANEGGTVTGGGNYTHNTEVPLTANANEGYHFVKWTENGNVVSTSLTYSFTVDKNRDLTAVFEPHSWKYTASGDTITAACDCGANGGSVVISAENAIYDGTEKIATYKYSGDCKFAEDALGISYQYRTMENESYVDTSDLTKAGYYKASITVGDQTAFVEYYVAKSDTGMTAISDKSEYTYGDEVVITVSGIAPKTEMMKFSLRAPADNEVAIFNGATQITEPQPVTSGQALTFMLEDLNAGEYILTANYTGNENLSTTSAAISFKINKANPNYTVPSGLTATYGQTLANVTLPNGFTWQDDSTTSVGPVGDNTFKVIYTPDDIVNYNIISGIDVVVNVQGTTSDEPGTVQPPSDDYPIYIPSTTPKDEPKEPSKMDAVTACHGDASCPISGYTDIDNDAWYHDGVHYCIENGIMGGYGNGIFRPNVAVSRAQISAMLWNMAGNPVVNYALDYKDVPADAWYTEAVRWMVSQNIAGGYGKGIYAPDDTLTREQLAAILQKYAQYKGYDMAANKEVDLQSYSDAASISDWAYASMQWICDSGIVGGMPGTNGDIILAPAGHATRAQVATMLMTFCEMEKE